MKIIFFGLGSIGRRHARLILNEYSYEVFAYRTNKGQYNNDLDIPEVYDWDQVKSINPDIVFITNPTNLHIETAINNAELDCAIFMEKPIGANLNDFDTLLRLVEKNKLVTYVGYDLRFHPVIKKLKKYFHNNQFLHYRAVCTSYLPDWRPEQNHRKSYSSINELGGGVLLDLSHEFDYTAYLLGGITELDGNFERKSDITVDSEDYANILVKSPIGYANIHINFISHYTTRKIYIDFAGFSVVGDLINNSVVEYKNGRVIFEKNYELDNDDIYKEQLKYFFGNIHNPKMQNNILEASTLFQKIIDFKNKINTSG